MKINKNDIFVFGSNEGGIHGAGAAKHAIQYGAVIGCSYGQRGQTFAIPTKDEFIVTMPLERIEGYVRGFLAYVEGHRKLTFKVTQIGCGLAGLQPYQIAPMFRHNRADTLPNIQFDEAWADLLCSSAKFWGTFP